TSTGVANDTIQLDYFNGSSTVTTTRDITGTGTLPAVIVISEAEPYNFGTVATGSVREHVFTLTNTGGSTALTMSGGGVAPPYSFAGGSYPGTGGTCGATLVPDGSCTINVSYAPVASSAGDTDSIDIDYYDGSISQTAFRGIIGVAAIPALLSISNGPSYDFGAVSVGQIKDRVFTIINSGGYTASSMMGGGLAKPFSFAGGSYPGSGGTCTASLASGASCTVVVRYAPTQAGYKYNDALSISYDDGVLNQTVERDLTGSSESPAVLELSISGSHNSVFTFPDVTIGKGNPELATITIKNNGATVATLLKAENGFDAPFGFVGGAYPGTGGTCGANLKSQESCTLQVHFAPKTFGHFSDTLAISYYDGSKKQILLQYFEGEGVKPQANPMSQAAL
ncbi:MAG: choice-of-anchor D domain-containing protein, partial [Bdellovibrionaceae bacterium]|nr:choice-of-anchor D domain-containing protein [Pseudobdellovibrionaceae bacterium]